MKTLNAAIACMLAIGLTTGYAAAQGSLIPPGAPTPTMKTLEQVEPRMPISSVSYTITQGGSYYLTTNLTAGAGQNGITVTADNVAIDMMGFTLTGSGAGSGYGIYQSNAYQNLRVFNGKVVGWQGNARAGIHAEGYNNQISNVQATQNHYGIYVGPNSVVTECGAHENDVDGIFANDGSAISKCSVNENGGNGIFTFYGTVSKCSARWNVGSGISANGSSTIEGCTAFGNHAKGIDGGVASTISDCQASANWEGGICGVKGTTIQNCASYVDFVAGILVGSNCTVKANTCARNGRIVGDAAGIHATGPDNRIESNHVVDNDRGLDIDAPGNHVADNTVKGNDDNYDIAQGNQLNILLCEVPESVDWPASVKLAGALASTDTSAPAISVNAPDVLVDLGGHLLNGPESGTASGVLITTLGKRATIRNGSIAGFQYGIRSAYIYNGSHLLENLTVSGCTLYGISAGVSSRIVNCHACSNTGTGIHAISGSSMSGCTAYDNQGYSGIAAAGSSLNSCTAYNNQCDAGIYAVASSLSECIAFDNQGDYGINAVNSSLSGCIARDNQCDAGIHAQASSLDGCVAYNNKGSGSSSCGIEALDGSTIVGCSANFNSHTNSPGTSHQGIGIAASNGSMVKDCSTSFNKGDGIRISGGCLAAGNICDGNGFIGDGAGLHVTYKKNRIENNNVTNNDRGIDVEYGENFITRNTASGNNTNWVVSAGNTCLVVLRVHSTAIIGNSGGTPPGSTDPNANYTY